MSSSNTTAHPLAPPDDNDDFDDLANIIDINMSKHKPKCNTDNANHNNSINQVKQSESSQSFPLPPKVTNKKRLAPQPPTLITASAANLSEMNVRRQETVSSVLDSSFTNNSNLGADCYFFIDINHVRWFYKGEKDKSVDKENNSNPSPSVQTISTPSNTSEYSSEMTSSTSSATSNDLNTTVSNLLSNR